MKVKRTVSYLVMIAVGASLVATSLLAQGGNTYKVRLAPAPPLGVQGGAKAVAGIGSASATLSGRKLTVSGSFEKMASPATVAKVGMGIATGARQDLILDLTLTKSPQADPPGTAGTIAGSFDLTPAQADALRKGRLYIQINSEGAPNGHLLGWLLK